MIDPVIPAQKPHLSAHVPAQDTDAEEAPEASDRPGDSELQALAAVAGQLNGDSAALLDLLRRLEQLHRTIQDGPFRDSLPGDRNRLYQLLESMEDSGGWPYIPRLQLRTFMELLQRGEDPEGEGSEQPPLAA
jgi:hypothetical protein